MANNTKVTRRVLQIDLHQQNTKLFEFTEQSLLPISLLLLNSLACEGDSQQITNRNFVIISTGILGGYPGLGLSVSTITGISPQSNRLGEAKIEGELASTLRGLTLDGICITGQSKTLIGIKIKNLSGKFKVDFINCNHLSGMSVWSTTDQVKENDNTILAIGKPGELKFPASSVVCDYGFPTQTGGFGALFGNLGVKYISLEKTKGTQNVDYLDLIAQEYMNQIAAGSVLTKYQFDPPGFGIYVNESLTGYLAGGNFAEKLPAQVSNFDSNSFLKFYHDNNKMNCPSCPQNCLKMLVTDDAKPKQGFMLHQLGVTVFATQWGDIDTRRCLEFNAYCHETGVEHLYTSALLTQESPSRNLPVDELINSVTHLRLNPNALTVKQMPIPPFDPRGNQGLGLAMALNPTGPRYDVVEHDIDFDPKWSWVRHSIFGREFGIPEGGIPVATLNVNRLKSVALIWKLWSALDALGVCIFASPPTRDLRLTHIIGMVKFVTNRDITKAELLELGLQRLTLMRNFNLLLGYSPSEDNLPEYFFTNHINGVGQSNISDPIFGNQSLDDATSSNLHTAKLSRSDFENGKKFIYKEFDWDYDLTQTNFSDTKLRLAETQSSFSASKIEVTNEN